MATLRGAIVTRQPMLLTSVLSGFNDTADRDMVAGVSPAAGHIKNALHPEHKHF